MYLTKNHNSDRTFPLLEVGFFIVKIFTNGYWSEMEKIYLLKSNSLEIFNLHLSDLILEVEGIKIRAERNDIEGIKEYLQRMNAILLEIMNAKLDLAEKCNNITN